MKHLRQILFPIVVVLLTCAAAPAQILVQKDQQIQGQSPNIIKKGEILKPRESRNELRCRGGSDGFRIDNLGPMEQTPGGETIVTMLLNFLPSQQAAGEDVRGLEPGTCSFVDRTVNEGEPKRIQFETSANAQLKRELSGGEVDRSPTAAERFADAITIPQYLTDPNHYWTFYVVKTNDGYFRATGHQSYKTFRQQVRDKREQVGRNKAIERASEINTQRTAPEPRQPGSDQGIIIVGGKKVDIKAKGGERPKVGGMKPTADAPTLTANPNPVIISKGQTQATTTVTWDAGPTFPYCEVYMAVNGKQTELGRGHDGTNPVTIQLGSTYLFWMIVYLGDRGETVTEVARMTVIGQEGNARIGGSIAKPGIIIQGIVEPLKGRSEVEAYVFFNDVRVGPGASFATFSFTAAEPSQFFIEVSKQRPSVRSSRVFPGEKLQATFPQGTQLAAFTLPGLSGVPSREHRVTLRGVPGQSLEPNTTYHYVITAKAPDGVYWRHVDQFTTLDRTVRVVFERVTIYNDSDPDTGPIRDCGEIYLWFWANYGEPSGRNFTVDNLNNNNACSVEGYGINRELVIESAPNTLSLSVSGEDYDPDFSPLGTPFRESRNGHPPLTGPEDTGDYERNVAADRFDLASFEVDGEIPFNLSSMFAPGGRRGDLMFTVSGRIVITHSRQ